MEVAFGIAILIVLILFMIFGVISRTIRKVSPNQALIVYGWGGTHVKRSSAIVAPIVQSVRELSLELMSFDVAPTQDLYTNQGVAVTVEAVAQLKVKSDNESILTAAEQFLNKTADERENLLRLVMEGHLRGIVGQLTVEQIVKDPEMVADRMRANIANDMAKMGLEVISFTIKEVRDKNEYIVNMGRPDVARIKRDADVASAEAERDTAIRRSVTMRESAVAKATADQERVIAETASATRQAEAQRDLDLKRAEYAASIQEQRAVADKAYDIQANVMEQKIVAEQVRVKLVEREEQTRVEEAEIQRRQNELVATVLKPAEVERQRIETLASAEQNRLAREAAGRAEAARQQGQAEADVLKLKGQSEADIIRLKGQAEAEIILAKGRAEAESMQVKAAAFQSYNQAAVVDKFLTSMPEVVRAMAEPLAKVDRITIVSTGGSDGSRGIGADQITQDVAKMVAQVPALFETLTGMKVNDLMNQIPALGSKPAGENGHVVNGVSTPAKESK